MAQYLASLILLPQATLACEPLYTTLGMSLMKLVIAFKNNLTMTSLSIKIGGCTLRSYSLTFSVYFYFNVSSLASQMARMGPRLVSRSEKRCSQKKLHIFAADVFCSDSILGEIILNISFFGMMQKFRILQIPGNSRNTRKYARLLK